MTLAERLQQLVATLPSDGSAVLLTRRDLVAMLEDAPAAAPAAVRDLSVEEVATELGRAPSTVRGWLIAGDLHGYKLNGRDWRVPRSALREYLERQKAPEPEPAQEGDVDISAWRKLRKEAR